MKVYKYKKDTLQFVSFTNRLIGYAFLFTCALFLISFKVGEYVTVQKVIELEGGIHIIKENKEPFSKDALINKIKSLNFKYPHIVLAQSITETGHWKSIIFKENNNLFGMREASRRIHTALGTQLNHAYYNNWQESVYDYAFYQCRYLSKIDSEQEYFNALKASYAEDPGYVNTLKKVIKKENLKELFK
tara:strand:- start:725 stop:1291 length:567 start_codon:yes stop_codon:yes gene_type:complete